MATVLPKITDHWRCQKNGKRRRYVGQILLLDGGTTTVIAEVYGWTLHGMRARKRAVVAALKKLHEG